jgi:GT2 family glycosyltransferase
MDTPVKSLAIVIGHYGGVDLAWRCLTHLWLFAPGIKVILVDDGSPDDLHKMQPFLESMGVLYQRQPENQGLTKAWNLGVKLAGKVDLVGFLNNDASVMPRCVDQLVWASDASKVVCARDYQTGERFDPSQIIGRKTERVLTDNFLSTLFVVDRLFGEQVGWFDERMRTQFSDVDFWLRCNQAGVSPVVVETAMVHHAVSMSHKRLGSEKASADYLKDQLAYREKWNCSAMKPERFPELFRDVAAIKAEMDKCNQQSPSPARTSRATRAASLIGSRPR